MRGRQMMDVVHADVGGEPAQHRRQVEVRAAVQPAGMELPARVALPVGVLELVLDVEQPDAHGRGEPGDRQLDQEQVARADQPGEGDQDGGDGEVGRHHVAPGPGARSPRVLRQALAQHEDEERPEAEDRDRMPEEPVEQPAPSGQCAELPHGQRLDVALAAPVEIARGAVVQGVLVRASGRRGSASARRSRGRAGRWHGGPGRTSRGRNRAG